MKSLLKEAEQLFWLAVLRLSERFNRVLSIAVVVRLPSTCVGSGCLLVSREKGIRVFFVYVKATEDKVRCDASVLEDVDGALDDGLVAEGLASKGNGQLFEYLAIDAVDLQVRY